MEMIFIKLIKKTLMKLVHKVKKTVCIVAFVAIAVVLIFSLSGCNLEQSSNFSETDTTDITTGVADGDVNDVVNNTEYTTEFYIEDTEDFTESISEDWNNTEVSEPTDLSELIALIDRDGFDGTKAYTTVNNNKPLFTTYNYEEEEYYSPLDALGRCGTCFARVSQATMPTESRGEIGHVQPAGWKTVKYNDVIEGNYLFNRCHIIGFQLCGENDNVNNLTTGTRFLNVDGMLVFENEVANYIHNNPDTHVLYRVTPVYTGNNLVADGILMEGYSVEDEGTGVCFCVYCYNVQPGITIDYSTGESEYTGEYLSTALQYDFQTVKGESFTAEPVEDVTEAYTEAYEENNTEGIDLPASDAAYIINTNTLKFHLPTCSSVSDIKASNKEETNKSKEELIEEGYSPCKLCIGE